MSRYGFAVKSSVCGAVLALALTGCTSSPAPSSAQTPKPVETVNPNTKACQEFASLTMAMPQKINDGTKPLAQLWEDIRVEFDTVALTASGTVKERMLDLANNWPDSFDVVVMHKFDGINGQFSAVQRACTAEKVNPSFGKLAD